MASYVGIGADDPNHPLEVEGQVFISNVEHGSATNLVPFEVYSDYTGVSDTRLTGARQMRLRVTPSAATSSNVNIDMGIEPTTGSYFYISNPVLDATLGSNTAFRIVQAGHVEMGSNLSVSGNVVASNIIGASPLTLSSDSLVKVAGVGGLSVTGPLNVTGTISQTGAVIGTSATYSGQVQAATVSSTGVINGASATVTGQVQAATVSSTGVINGASATVTGDVQGASASLGAIDGSSLTVTGQVKAATVSSTGIVRGASLRVNASNGLQALTGQYGSIETFGSGDWDGYSINGDFVFMAYNGKYGLYDDTRNQWGAYFIGGGASDLRHAGIAKLATTDGGVAVTGTISAANMYISDDLIHSGDTDTRLQFDVNKITLQAAGTNSFTVTNSGVRVAGTVSSSGNINCPALSVSNYIYHTDDTNTYMGFVNADDIVFNTNGAERMRIENTGDIGINTTNPTAKLDVNGDAKVGTFTVTSSQTMPDIGTNSAKLQFVLADTGGIDTWGNYADNYTTSFGFLTTTYTRLTWDVNGSDRMRLDAGGDLDIDGTYGTFSDYRIKENIQSIDDDYAMGVIRGLEPKSYTWKDKEKGEGTEYGFLAQEVKALYPEMVSTGSGTIPMDQMAYPSQITSDTTMEITVSDGSTWTSGDKIAVNDSTNYRHTLTVHEIQNSVLSLTAETISSNMVDSNSETYIYGKEVDDLHGMKVSYLDPLMISALQQLDRRVAALENR